MSPTEAVGFRQTDGSGFLALYRQQGRLFRTAMSADRTFAAARRAREADQRAELHEGGIELARPVLGNERKCSPPKMRAAGGGINGDLAVR